MPKRLFLAVAILLAALPGRAQEDADWRYECHLSFGVNLFFYTGHKQKFPGWKAFAGASFAAINKRRFLFNYGPSLALYSKSLGANLNPLSDDVQLDFANSFSAGYWWGGPYYTKFLRTFGDAAFYNTVLDVKNAALLSTIFVFNNHQRHQALGAVTGSFGDVTINYYNDGGLPIELGAISDHFDRYWTGGLGIFFHNNDRFNTAEFLFDQFTGYTPMLYEVSSILGIRLPEYNLADSGRIPTNFNTAAYNLRIMPYRNFGVDIGVIGSLRSNGGRVYGLQDIIHTLGRYALHPNNDHNRLYLGGTYLNNPHVKL